MTKSFFSLLSAFVIAVSMALMQVLPAYADVNLPPEINQQFTPLQINAGDVSVLRITIFNPNSHSLTDVLFTDNLIGAQPGLFIASSGLKSNTCVGGIVTAVPGSSTISMVSGTVDPQVTNPGQCYVEVYVSSITAGNLINTIDKNALSATGSGGVTIKNTSPASATITVIAIDPPSMSKTFAPNTIYVGETSQLTITINNNDALANLTDVSFTDTLPANVILANPVSLVATGCGAIPTAIPGGTTVALSGGTITPAVDCVIKVNVTGTTGTYKNIIPAGPAGPGSLHTQQGVTNNDNVEADLNIQPVSVSKVFSPTTIAAGNTATLTITLNNPTLAAYTSVGISDTLPAGLIITGTPSTTCGSGTITTSPAVNPTALSLAGGTIPAKIPPAALGTCTITATVKADLSTSGTLKNTIPKNTLTAAQPGVTNVLDATASIIVIPALVATKSFTDPYVIGKLNATNEVTITLTNNSSTPLTGVTFTDNLPTGLDVSGTPASPQCGAAGIITRTLPLVTPASVTLTGGSIPANSSCTIKFFVTSATPGTYSNSIGAGAITTAQCSPTCVGNKTAITTSTGLTVVNADQLPVEVSKAFNPAATAGSTSKLTITITAPLDLGINGINLTDTLPSGLTIAAPNPPTIPNPTTTCPGGTARLTANTGAGQIIFANLGTDPLLLKGTSCTIVVYVTALPGIYPNNIGTSTISTAQGRTNEITAASDTLSVTGLTMKKAFYPTAVQANGKSVLTITLENTSNKDLTNVTLKDVLPGNATDGVFIASPLVATTTCGTGSVTSDPTDPTNKTILLSGAGSSVPAQVGGIPGICTVTVEVQGKGVAGNYTNTIPVNQVTATDGNSLRTINPLKPASASLAIKNMKIGVVKGFDPVLVYGGATSTMTVKLINPNSAQLTGITFTDDMDLFYAAETPPNNVSGIKLADPPTFNTGTCGGTLSGTQGDSSFTFSGGVLQPNSSCTLTLRVIMSQNGSRTNLIPVGAVTTFNGIKSDQPTQASLTNLPGVGVVKTFNPNPVTVGNVSKLTITISNTSNVPVREMHLKDEFPALPAQLVIAGGAAGGTYLATNTCIDPAAPVTVPPVSLTAIADTQVIELINGSLAGKGDPGGHDVCKIEINVVSLYPGAFINTIPVGAITAKDGITNVNPATDTLRVGSLYSLGNRVWYDTNNNGVIDSTEVGIDGVTVKLYSADASGNPTNLRGMQVTSSGGYYRFDDLEPGDYIVSIPVDNFSDLGVGDVALTDPLKGYLSSGTTIAADGTISDSTSNSPNDDIDSDENGWTQVSSAVFSKPVTLGPGASEPTNDTDMPLANPFGESPNDYSNRSVDFGFYRTSLGNQVFLDSNANGTYDGGDSPISGATVQLFASNATTEVKVGPDGILGTSDDAAGGVTTVGGIYMFSGLPQGDYVVKVTPPAGKGYSSTIDTYNPSDSANPNYNEDLNDNGLDSSVTPPSEQVSTGVVTITPGGGTKPVGGNKTNILVSDSIGFTYDSTVDFGFLLYSLGNRVWYDTNNNGVIDGTEVGISSVRVQLYQDNGNGVYDAGDTFIGNSDTDTSGYYRFDNLSAGNYVVVIPSTQFATGAPLAGYWSSGTSITSSGTLSDSIANNPETNISDTDENGATTFSNTSITSANPINYVSSSAVTLGGSPEPIGETDLSSSGQGTADNRANMTVDFGFYRTAIGDLVFTNGNATDDGKYDVGIDNPLAGAIVKVFASDGTTQIPVGADGILGTGDDSVTGLITSANGLYAFNGLPAGDYVIKVTPPAGGYISMIDTADSADNANPDVNTNNNDNGIGTAAGEVTSGQLTMSPATEVLSSTITQTNATGTTTDTSVDFGFISPFYSLGNRVWYDTNNNGAIDAGESGVNGVRVELYFDTNANGVYDAGTDLHPASNWFMNTDATGYYRFDNLAAGEYLVVIPSNQFTAGGSLSGYWSSGTTRADNGTISDNIITDPDNDTDSDDNGVTTFNVAGTAVNYVSSSAVTLGVGDTEPINENDPTAPFWQGTGDSRANMTVDFGFYRTAIGNLVFVDNNNNGIYNAGAGGDVPLSGATVQLFTGDGSTQIGANVTTPAAGTYSFTNLPAGNYVVKVTPPVGYSSAIDTAGSLNPNSNINNDDNGIGTAAGVVVTSSGVLAMNPGVDASKPTRTITAGNTTDNTMDFGFVPLRYSLGNRVWFDTNNNSLWDSASEQGVNAVRVELYQDNGTTAGSYDAGDTYLGFANTDTNGYYRFDNLLAGNYVVVIPSTQFATGGPLAGYWSSGTSTNNAGAISDSTSLITNDPDNDIDNDDNGVTTFSGSKVNYVSAATITLGPGTSEPTNDNDPSTNPASGESANDQSNRAVDFGFYKTEIGNQVFEDVNLNGTYDVGDTAIDGVRVRLYAADNATEIPVGPDGILGTADDAANGVVTGPLAVVHPTWLTGEYHFSDLPAGNYIVKAVAPNGMISTIDTNPQNDNDNPNWNADNNDNGDGMGNGTITSDITNSLTMTPGGGTKPDATAKTNVFVTNSNGATTDSTVDFGFVNSYSLGNRIWFDTNNNGVLDALESGIAGVRVELYQDTNGNGLYNPGVDIHPSSNWFTTTDANGYYRFDNLFPGDYLVIIPADNFRNVGAGDTVAGDPLKGYWSSGTSLNASGVVNESATHDPDTDQDAYNNILSDENGATTFSGNSINYVSAAAVTLGANVEPLNETDLAASGQGTVDARANMTVDFGFYRVEIGNLVFMDVNQNGTNDAGDTTINNALVHLYASNNTTEIITGGDGILGTADDGYGPDGVLGGGDDGTGGVRTGPLAAVHPAWAAGEYRFNGLPTGSYIVKVDAPTGTVSTIDTFNLADNTNPNTNINNNDNGVGGTGGTITSNTANPIIMNPGTDALKPIRTVSDATGTTSDLTMDFGFTELVAIGNRIWLDTGTGGGIANNGILDGGEIGVANGVVVELHKSSDDSLVASTTTANFGANLGYYKFDNLLPGTYYVKIPASEFASGRPLFGYVSTIGSGAVNNDSDQNVDENGIDGTALAPLTTNGIRTPNYTLIPNTEPAGEDQANYPPGALDDNNVNFTADLGFVKLVAIGNRVWFDNGASPDDGIQQADELGVSGVRVELFRNDATPTFMGFVNTDANGNYQFDNLVPGDYFVHIPFGEFASGRPLFGYVSSTDKAAPKDETSDQNLDENGLDVSTLTTTGINTQVFTLTPGGETTTEDQSTYTGYLDNANVNFTADFGFLQKVAIGNLVWLDNGAGVGGIANDGKQNGTEPGISGVRVVLYTSTDVFVKSTTTDVSGYYVFDNLLPGQYYAFIPPSEFATGAPAGPLVNLLSSTGNGANETTDQIGDENGIDNATPNTNGIKSTVYDLQADSEPTGEPQPNYIGALDDNNVNFTADFGFTELVAIGNRIWLDTGAGAHYNNGILDADESGVADGVVVELHKSADDSLVASTTTSSIGADKGYYKFDNLFPGTYYVKIPSTEFDTNTDPLYGYVSTIDVAPKNQTSDQTVDENGIDGTTAFPLTAVGIRTNDYTLTPNTMPTGEDQTNYILPGNRLDDNNVNFTADFGFVQLVAIGNRIWYDIGGGVGGIPNDGIQNGSEAGAPNVTVELYREGDTIGTPFRTTTTDVNGNYVFDNLIPGRYFIHIPASMFDATLPSPLQGFLSSTGAGTGPLLDQNADENGIEVPDLAANGISSRVYTLTPNNLALMPTGEDQSSYIGYLDDDNVNFTADFGFTGLVAIGNRIWFDNGAGGGTANDGIQNGAEPGVNGVKVELYLSTQTPGVDTPIRTTTTITDTDVTSGLPGYYVFDNLLPGTYIVHIPASQFQPGGALEGYYSSLGAGTDQTLDQNVDENGIDQPNPAVTGISTMPYVLSANTMPTIIDNDGGYTGVLDDNDVNFTADFGFVQKYALGNRVWFDTNNNATMDVGEVGVDGVTVNLYAASDMTTILATDTTSNGGYYLFDSLYPGNYVVVIPSSNFSGAGKLVGYWSSLTTMGATGTTTETAAPNPNTPDIDSDDNGTRQASGDVISLPVTLGPSGDTEPTLESDVDATETGALHQGIQTDGRANMTVDFGFYIVEVGNLVYSDGNKNGNYDGNPTDAVLPGVTMHLFASNGTTEIITGADGILGTADDGAGGKVLTNATGNYLFSGLPQGDYIVTVDTPIGTSSTIDTFNAGDNANPNVNADNNDNGIGTSGVSISSGPVTLTPGIVVANPNNIVTNSNGSTRNPTLDFGFIPAFSLGNRVWYDTNNNGKIDVDPAHPSDPLYSEVGINGVTLEVYAADASGNPTGPMLGSDTTVANGADNGYYLFNPLPAGNYVVVIPASNFTGAGKLVGYWSFGISRIADGSLVETASPNPNNDIDSDDNGMYRIATNDVISKPITLGPNPTEPTNETDLNTSLPDADHQGQPNNRGNMTVDFGFYTIDIGNQVWNDANNSGAIDGVEAGMDNVDVELWTADGSKMLGTTTTTGGGLYGFSGLPQGDYIVRIPAVEFNPAGTLENYTSSTGVNSITPPVPLGPNEPAPDADVVLTDSDDNGTEKGGTLGLGGYIQSEPVTLNPTGESSYSNANGGTSESRVDFGVFLQSNHKPIIGAAKRNTSIVEVSPGTYDVTYEILVQNMGGVALNNVQVTDNLNATFTLPTTFTVQSITSAAFAENVAYNGKADINLLLGTDTLPVGASGTITLVVRVIPYKSGPFNNTAIASGTDPFGGAVVTDNSQDGVDTDPDKDGNPTNNNVPTPVNFGPNLFDPPIGIKTFDASGLPLLKWTMTWINSTNIAAVNARVSDPIPAGTTYVASGAPSGFPVPGAAPAGSTNIGVSCSSPSPLVTTTTLCYYEGPTVANPLGRIVWEGVLGPDFGHTTAAAAVNELEITFNVSVPSGVTTAYNIATIDTDLDGNGIYAANEVAVANSQAIWVFIQQEGQLNGRERRRASRLPSTGFAPGKVTILPEQPADKAYFDAGTVSLEIPRLGINTSIVGIPQADDGSWDVSWLWQQTGWLQGTAYPTLAGNSAITGHVYLPNGKPGPFVDIDKLAYGDKVIIHANGQKYIYEVRENKQVKPSDTSVLKNEDKAWITLLTCQGYNESNNTYTSRVAVRAVLMKVEKDSQNSGQ